MSWATADAPPGDRHGDQQAGGPGHSQHLHRGFSHITAIDTPLAFRHLRNCNGGIQMVTDTFEFRLDADTWAEIKPSVVSFATRQRLPMALTRKAIVCLDELFGNVVKYGSGDAVTLALSADGGRVRVVFEDSGSAFDPVAWCRDNVPQPDLAPDKVGCAGLHLVMGLSSTVAYDRVGDRDRVIMTFE
jgi:anti-sigma regulatory factor (Ser/Thr protein kinase)